MNIKYLLHVILYAIILVTISSCGSSKKTAQTQRYYQLQYDFTTDKSYQEVYRTIMNGVNSCVRHIGTSKSIAEGQMFNDLKAADIVIMQQSFLGKYPHINIRIDNDGVKTSIQVKNDFDAWDDFSKTIKYWVTDGLDPC